VEADAWVVGATAVNASGLDIQWWARDELERKDKHAAPRDDAIMQAITDALAQDPRVSPSQLEVSVQSGAATLRGVVDNLRAKQAARDTASNVYGVTQVNNLLRVRPGAERTTTELETDIRAALMAQPEIERHTLRVNI